MINSIPFLHKHTFHFVRDFNNSFYFINSLLKVNAKLLLIRNHETIFYKVKLIIFKTDQGELEVEL